MSCRDVYFHVKLDSRRLEPYQRVAIAALLSVIVLIFVGAIVRATGAGLGCCYCITSCTHEVVLALLLLQFSEFFLKFLSTEQWEFNVAKIRLTYLRTYLRTTYIPVER